VLSRRAEFFAGIRAELPILLGVSPFGLIYGVLALSAGLPAPLAFAMSSVVFAGSAQFVGAQLLGSGAPGVVVVATTFVSEAMSKIVSSVIGSTAGSTARLPNACR